MIENTYAGFWVRFGACLIDSIIFSIIISIPMVMLFANYSVEQYFSKTSYDWFDLAISVVSVFAVIYFWLYHRATPGKMLFNLQVVDANTGATLSIGQCIIRNLGYIVAAIPLCLGFIWVGFDKKKQGWHDKMCGSVVVQLNKN